MKTPKLGKWIPAHRVRVVKVNGKKVLEVQRTVKKTPTKTNAGPNSKRKSKKRMGPGSGASMRLGQAIKKGKPHRGLVRRAPGEAKSRWF